MWVGSMILEYGYYILWVPSNELGIFFYYSYNPDEFENLGGLTLPALVCARITVHLGNIHRKHNSSNVIL